MTFEMFCTLQEKRLADDVKRTGGPRHPLDYRPPWFKRVEIDQHKAFSTPIPPKRVGDH